MPHTRLDRITFTVYGANETELIAAARHYLGVHVTDVEQWTMSIDAEPNAFSTVTGSLAGSVVATHRPPPAPPKDAA